MTEVWLDDKYKEALADNAKLRQRVAALEMVIREELVPEFCDCEMNKMLVTDIHRQSSQP